MSVLSFLVCMILLSLVIAGLFWIGVYVVLPIVLLWIVVSFSSSIIKNFVSKSDKKEYINHQKNKQNQVIDVEFEEIKE